MDSGGKADPMIVMSTGPYKHVETSVKKNSLEPEWNETFYLTVEEPKDQMLRLEMFDIDMVGGGTVRYIILCLLFKILKIFKYVKNM